MGPTVRAGLMDAPVVGATGMMAAKTPKPTSLAFRPRTPMIAAAPMIAPTTCAPMYAGTCDQGNLPDTARPSVTAGLMWLPPTWPSAYTVATTTVPNAREITPRSAIVNGALPLTIRVAGTDPTPMNTRNAVPMTSAPRRWKKLVSSSMGLAPSQVVVSEQDSTSSNKIWRLHL